jgi:hypothetical protein
MKHLQEVNMTYFQHLRFAWSIAFAAFVHGIFPWLLTDYVTKKITGSLAARSTNDHRSNRP